MNKVIKNGEGKYFVHGSGFVGSESTATTFESCSDAQGTIKCLASVGITGVEVVNKAIEHKSFAVCYIREKDINANGGVTNKKLESGWPSTPSPRRFASFGEAVVHGSRFQERRVNRDDKPGTCNHKGFYVIETKDPVNAKVNPATGLTNTIKE